MLYPSHWGGKSTELPFFASSTLALANRHHHPRTVFTTSTTALASLTTFVSLGRIQLAACPNLARKQRFFPLQRRVLRTFAVARTLLLRLCRLFIILLIGSPRVQEHTPTEQPFTSHT